MAAHLGKRKRCRADGTHVKDPKAPKLDRLRTQQPTPPTSTNEGFAHRTRNYIDFDFDSTWPSLPDLKRTDPETGASPDFDFSHDEAVSAPPSPFFNNVDSPYDPDFGAKVCERWRRIRWARERRYGFTIAAVYPPGRTPLQVRRVEHFAQGELKRRYDAELEGTDEGSQGDIEACEREDLESKEDDGEELEHEVYHSSTHEREEYNRAEHESAECECEWPRTLMHDEEEEVQKDGDGSKGDIGSIPSRTSASDCSKRGRSGWG